MAQGTSRRHQEKFDETENRAIDQKTPMTAPAIFESIRRQGETELKRPNSSLAISGLIAGLALGFSPLAQALFHSHLPDTDWRPLVTSLGYTLGFIIVILGQLQLFTENTITAVCPVLDDPCRESFSALAQLWVLVFTFNVIGAGTFGWILWLTQELQPQVWQAVLEIADHTLSKPWPEVLLRGVGAGWLIAALVWSLANAEGTKLWVIIVFMYFVALAGFAHVIADTTKAVAMAMQGSIGWMPAMAGYVLPALIGNIVGGTVVFTGLTWAQLRSELAADPQDAA